MKELSLNTDGPTVDPNIPFIYAFDTIHIIGLIVLGSTLLTAWLSPRIQRGSLWFGFNISWLSASAGHLLLLGQQTGPLPNRGLCLLQATLVYGTPVFYAFYAASFMLHVHLSITRATAGRLALSPSRIALFHLVPCFAFASVIVEVICFALTNPSTLERDPSGMYCNISERIPNHITASLCIACVLPMLGCGVLVYRSLRRSQLETGKGSIWTDAHVTPDIVVRVLVFCACPLAALVIGALQYLPWDRQNYGSGLNIALATLPTCVGLIFGTQRDILRVWMFWKKRDLLRSRSSNSSWNAK